MVSIYPVVKAMHHIYIYISLYLPVKGNTRISLKESTFFELEICTSLEGLEPTISRLHTKFHYSSCLRSSKQVISNIFLYIRVSNKKKLYENDKKNMNWICPMTAILNFTICGKTVSFTAWHTAEMDSAQNFNIETKNEVFFLKNAYRSLSRAIFQFFVLTNFPHKGQWRKALMFSLLCDWTNGSEKN